MIRRQACKLGGFRFGLVHAPNVQSRVSLFSIIPYVHFRPFLKLALFGFAWPDPQGDLFVHNPLLELSLPGSCPAGKLALF
jgi:hypothetical protein